MSAETSPTDDAQPAGTHGATVEQRWDREWSNVAAEREEGTHKVSEWNLRKRKTRHLAQKRDISRGRASHLLKYEGVEVPDEVVL